MWRSIPRKNQAYLPGFKRRFSSLSFRRTLRRESTRWAFRNCKNSLKSGGSGIVDIRHLSEQLQSTQTLFWSLCLPEGRFVAFVVEQGGHLIFSVDYQHGERAAMRHFVPRLRRNPPAKRGGGHPLGTASLPHVHRADGKYGTNSNSQNHMTVCLKKLD